MIHGHGDDIYTELKANFSSNVWYGADNKGLYQHLSDNMHRINRYPEPNPDELKKLLGEHKNIHPSQIIVCNGSTEAFYLIAQSYAGKKSLIVSPSFSEYADACTMHQHLVYQKPRTYLAREIEALQPDLVWICNPNNPDGYCMTANEMLQLITQFPNVIFVVDQAYIDYSLVNIDVLNQVENFSNIIVIQSLTKRHAIPGLRLGYIVSNKTIIAQIEKNRIPWSVNVLAIEAGKYLLQTQSNGFNLEQWLESAKNLQESINTLSHFEAIPSSTPYFLVKLKQGTAHELKSYLIEKKILVRDATNFKELDGEMIRICTLSATENALLIENLAQWTQCITA